MKQENIDVITMGIPSKGVLYEGSAKLLAEAGLNYIRNPKQYVAMAPFYKEWLGSTEPYPMGAVQLAFMRPADIVKRVNSGDLDLGIAGGDTREELDAKVGILQKLDFGRCDLVLAIDEARYDEYSQKAKQVEDDSDLLAQLYSESFNGSRVGTPYPNLARKYTWYRQDTFEVFPISGASEGLIKLGWADAIIDLTETGKALQENGLKVFSKLDTYQAELLGSSETMRIRESCDFTGSNRFLQCLVDRLQQSDRTLYRQREQKEAAKESKNDQIWKGES